MTMKTTKRPTIAGLIQAKRMFAADPAATLKTGLWDQPYWTSAEFNRYFAECLNRRINRDDPRAAWRKMQPEYQTALALDARRVNEYQQRIRHTGCRGLLRLPEMQQRYPHINNQTREF